MDTCRLTVLTLLNLCNLENTYELIIAENTKCRDSKQGEFNAQIPSVFQHLRRESFSMTIL